MRERDIKKITYLFMITYMVSYITRINYGAVISEIVEETGIQKSMLALALTGSFATYAIGQIISGICGDRFHPKKLLTYGLVVSVLMNLLIPFCPGTVSMVVVWSVNGLAQAFMWPPMVKLMTELLTVEDYNKACVIVARGSSFGTIIVYLLAPFIIKVSGWRMVFISSAIVGILAIFLWTKMCPEVAVSKSEKKRSEGHTGISLLSPLMLGIMLAIVLQGILKDGVTTWMPSYISETYDLGNEISILTGILLPIFSMICYQIGFWLHKNKFKNPVTCSAVIFFCGAISAFVLYFLAETSAVTSVLLSALLTGCMHGVNLMLISIVPGFFRQYGNVSTVSGVLNACTYLGSAVSTYGIAAIAENSGWNFTIFVWFLVAVAGSVVCLLCIRSWGKLGQDYKSIPKAKGKEK